ncbi:hypothetical protein FNF27_02817 [Cafeteria roenbergensis]|uniref:Uncharacterized protein n=1 Tax=Cafeteria roenbergensis TaxID=33653 RepID=A0A5A8EIX0_CAFRO|nr:hypothetical protein FNF27_02817 [Cafeteria roenbergensis]
MAFDGGSARLHLASSAPGASDEGPGLSIKEQPLSVWYKDQGGKKALLSTVVGASVKLTHVVPLQCRLLLESGSPPPDAASLLQIEGLSKTDMLALGPSASEITVSFRIAKVSRNFDNSRFVLEISPDYEKAAVVPPPEQQLRSVRTFPILVKSKRRRTSGRGAGDDSSVTGGTGSETATAGPLVVPPSLTAPSQRPGADDGLLRTVLAEQRQQSQMMATILSNQMAIMSRLGIQTYRPRMFAPPPHGAHDYAVGAGAGVGVPPAPEGEASQRPGTPGQAGYRREGTDSSINSAASDVSLLTSAPDIFGAGVVRGSQPVSAAAQAAAVACSDAAATASVAGRSPRSAILTPYAHSASSIVAPSMRPSVVTSGTTAMASAAPLGPTLSSSTAGSTATAAPQGGMHQLLVAAEVAHNASKRPRRQVEPFR